MKFDPQKHHRHSIRLKEYDYSSPGAYFITIVTYQREFLFGEIINGEMRFNPTGEIVLNAWLDLPDHYPHITLDAFVIMPNHVHGIIVLEDNNPVAVGAVGAGLKPTRHTPTPVGKTSCTASLT